MNDFPLDIAPPFDFMPPSNYERERKLRLEANERARYLIRKHDLREPVAWTVAIGERGAGVPRRIGTSSGTVGGYIDRLIAQFGPGVAVWKPEAEREGELEEVSREEVFNYPSHLRAEWFAAAAENLEHVPGELRDAVRERDVAAEGGGSE